MNLKEMHDKVDFWADKVKSPRYSRTDRDQALNTAIDSFVKDRYDNIKQQRRYSFEVPERVREELYPIIVDDYPISIVGQKTDTPPDFSYHLLTTVTVNGKQEPCDLKTYQESDLSKNSFTKPGVNKIIHRRTATGFTFSSGKLVLGPGLMTYLKNHTRVKFDETPITQGLTALIIGRPYYVVSGIVNSGSIIYPVGSVFTATIGSFTGTGIVNNLTQTELPVSTHEEICKIAASVLTGTFEDYQKSQKVSMEAERS
jgi:hypothetical protein